MRALERALPISLFTRVFGFHARLGVVRVKWFRRRRYGHYEHMPPLIRPGFSSTADRKTHNSTLTNLRLAELIFWWPDRLRTSRWSSRCSWVGVEPIEALLQQGQSIILAGLHAGPIRCLPLWLRSRGLAAATLANLRPFRPHQFWLDSIADEANDLRGVPRRFGTAQMRDILAHLRPGRVLYVAIDGVEGRRIDAVEEGVRFRMATGFLRLAARTGSRVVPCHIETNGPLQFTIYFGTELPHSLVDEPANHAEAGRHLVRQLVPFLKANPHQYLLSHLREYHEHPTTLKPLWQEADCAEKCNR